MPLRSPPLIANPVGRMDHTIMESRKLKILLMALAAATVVGGVSLAGTQGNPWNLWMVWFFAGVAVDPAVRRRRNRFTWITTAVILAAALAGVLDTLGAEGAHSVGGGMICFGLVLGLMAAAELGPLASRRGSAGHARPVA